MAVGTQTGWSKRRGTIYFAGLANGAVRVGFTTRPAEVRVNEARAGLGPLTLLAEASGMIADEGAIHRALRDVRISSRPYRNSVYRASAAVLVAMQATAGTRFRITDSAANATYRLVLPTEAR